MIFHHVPTFFKMAAFCGSANGYILLQSRLAQQGLSILDVGGAGDCFFRAVSHQLYGEPSYHMNIRCVGVQYMRTKKTLNMSDS